MKRRWSYAIRGLLLIVVGLLYLLVACVPQSTNTSNPTSIPPLTAQIIAVHPYSSDNTKWAVLFSSNLGYCVSAKYTIKQHDANGNFLGESAFITKPIPPKSRVASTLPSDLAGELSIANLQIEQLPSASRPTFSNMKIRDIYVGTTKNSHEVPTYVLAGTLINMDDNTATKPTSMEIQVLTRTKAGDLILVGDSSPYSNPHSAANLGVITYWGDTISLSPMLPPGERMNFYIALSENITILDGNQGIIDGEIIVVAPRQQ